MYPSKFQERALKVKKCLAGVRIVFGGFIVKNVIFYLVSLFHIYGHKQFFLFDTSHLVFNVFQGIFYPANYEKKLRRETCRYNYKRKINRTRSRNE